jgi:hypothetical protein
MNRGQRQAVQKGQVGRGEVRRLTRRWLSMPLAPALGLSEHPDQHPPERPVLLAVDQELGEGCTGPGVHQEEPIDRPTRRQDWTLSQKGQVLALGLYHQHWLWISFPRG